MIPNAMVGRPFPPPTHPAFEWLHGRQLAGAAIADLTAPAPHKLDLPASGPIIWATTHHGQAIVGGASSVWPDHSAELRGWLAAHDRPFSEPGFVPLLEGYGTRYLLLHMHSPHAGSALVEAAQNERLHRVGCFAGPAGPSPWSYPICVLEIVA
ncbi:MAG: hypothetical protein ACRDHL_06600 [Candidatus Promineifilaceae bacterium]